MPLGQRGREGRLKVPGAIPGRQLEAMMTARVPQPAAGAEQPTLMTGSAIVPPRVVARTSTVTALICAILLASGCRNLHHVDAGWWRSAQPEPSWLYDFLKEEGIEVILNLRGSDPGKHRQKQTDGVRSPFTI